MKNYLELSDFFGEQSLDERLLSLAERVKKIRKRRKLSQSQLANKSMVSLGSIKRFERTGQISLESLFRLAMALEIDKELDSLFEHVPPTYEEVLYG